MIGCPRRDAMGCYPLLRWVPLVIYRTSLGSRVTGVANYATVAATRESQRENLE